MREIAIGISLAKEKAGSGHKIRFHPYYRVRMFAITFLSDLMALILSTSLVHSVVYHTFYFNYLSFGEIEHILFAIICFSLFMASRLYSGIGLNPALEMKTVTQLTSVTLLIVFSFLMIRTPLWTQAKLVLVLIGGLSILTILVMRWLVRILAARVGVWGEPVAVVASKEKLENLMGYFNERRRLGFVPVLGGTIGNQSHSPMQMMDVDDLLKLPDGHFAQKGIYTVLVSTQIVSDLSKSGINRNLPRKFKRIIFVSEMDWLESVSIDCYDLEGMLGMEARQTFLTPPAELLKRMMDIIFSIILGIVFLPLLLLTAIMIKLDSPGPAFYKQERIGKGRRRITIIKFRSMQVNAEKVLAAYLAENSKAQEEWNKTQKLREDPRITRVGKWLRKFSIDELPQLFNVLKGDMSLVGPRPIVESEVWRYQNYFGVYSTVHPGITGMWQVSGRSCTTYDQRVLYDVYYVHNWSVWLDLYILLRTIWVVLIRDGAY
jgi:Undecaprenyl-phosphate galactose phosphotransferase WbaP